MKSNYYAFVLSCIGFVPSLLGCGAAVIDSDESAVEDAISSPNDAERWVLASNGIVSGAIVGGQDADGQPFYLCRAYVGKDAYVGKIKAGASNCEYVAKSRASSARSYQILTAFAGTWSPGGKRIPTDALQAATEAGARAYACRANYAGGVHLGTIRKGATVCSFSQNGQARTAGNFQVLTTKPTKSCAVAAPPAALNLNPFYKKYCSANGVTVASSGQVPNAALEQTTVIVTKMLSNLPRAKDALVANKVVIGIVGSDQLMTDMPEYANLYTQFPGTDWNTRARGLGATSFIPLSTAAEENILCYENDGNRGESIMVHEFAHTLKIMGIQYVDGDFESKVRSLYDSAMAAGRWANTYAATNAEEYWAEGVQSYFDTNLESTPPNGVHNDINTRAELETYDPGLYALIDSTFGGLRWSPTCVVPTIDPNTSYRLTNEFLGEGRALDTATGGANDPIMASAGKQTGQRWKFAPLTNGSFRVANQLLGAGRALDTAGDGANDPFMASTGDYSGQYWKLSPVNRSWYRLTNSFLGAGRSLDTPNDGVNDPSMAVTGNYSGQHWKLTPLD